MPRIEKPGDLAETSEMIAGYLEMEGGYRVGVRYLPPSGKNKDEKPQVNLDLLIGNGRSINVRLGMGNESNLVISAKGASPDSPRYVASVNGDPSNKWLKDLHLAIANIQKDPINCQEETDIEI